MSELHEARRLLREAQKILDRLTTEEADEQARLREERRLERLRGYRPRIVEGVRATTTP